MRARHYFILDDSRAFSEQELFVDAHLALAAVDQTLNASIDLSISGCAITTDISLNGGTEANGNGAETLDTEPETLRRQCSIILKSGQLRNLHDICFALGCGADAVNPYAMYEVALRDAAGVEQASGRCATASSCSTRA